MIKARKLARNDPGRTAYVLSAKKPPSRRKNLIITTKTLNPKNCFSLRRFLSKPGEFYGPKTLKVGDF